jgi:hypothetical protein
MNGWSMDAITWSQHWQHYKIGLEINGFAVCLMTKNIENLPAGIHRFCLRLGVDKLGLEGVQ